MLPVLIREADTYANTQYGLYSAFMGCFIYTLFGTSKDVTLGPTAIVSLLTESSTRGCGGIQARIVCATALTFLSGAIQFAVGILNLGEASLNQFNVRYLYMYVHVHQSHLILDLLLLFPFELFMLLKLHPGFLVEFIPVPVISGFTSAAAITIALGQLHVSMIWWTMQLRFVV